MLYRKQDPHRKKGQSTPYRSITYKKAGFLQALLLSLSMPLHAGKGAAQTESQASRADNGGIEEIVVRGAYTVGERLDTATGLGLTLQETPQSVGITTYQRIEDQALDSLTDVVNGAAGISSKAYDSSRNGFSSRGFDIDNYQLDGTPITWASGASAGETQTDTALYERVEVVRGATGLLTGAGNPSASINLVRKHADSREFTGWTSLAASRWNQYRAQIDVSAPLTANGALRARTVGVYEDGDSFVDFAGNRKIVAYAVVDGDLSDATSLSLGASYQDNDPTASQWGGLPIFFRDGSRADWPRSKTVGARWTYWATATASYFANLNHEFGDGWQARLDVNRVESSSAMRLLYLFGSPDPASGLGMGAFPRGYDNKRRQDSFGIRVNGRFDLWGREHELVLGGLHTEQDFIYYRYNPVSVPAVGNFHAWDGSYPQPQWSNRAPFQDETTEQTGWYAASRVSVTDALKVILGARLADWERSGPTLDDAYGDDSVVVPYVGALFDVGARHTLYASYTEIFNPQNKRDRNARYLDPLIGKNYEIGLKSRFYDGLLHTAITLFKTEQDNFAANDPNFVPTATQAAAFVATRGVESDGFELEVIGELLPGWEISANYTRFEASAEDSEGRANTVNTRYPNQLLRLFIKGHWSRLSVGAGVSWEGENYTEVTNPASGLTERASQGAYALLSAMARYRFSDTLSAQLNIDNALDETYYSQIGFFTQLAYGEPRNLRVTLRYAF